MDNKEISPAEQRLIQLDILKSIDLFCKSNSINYSLAFGTLLGAVRHKGFIPWDDDIDIMMTRENYERFREVYHSERYPLYDLKTNIKYPLSMGKIHDSRTYYYRSGIKRDLGLFIDIFPFDNVPEDTQIRQEWIKKIHKYNIYNIAKNTPIKYQLNSGISLLGKIRIILIKAFGNSSYIHKTLENQYIKYNKETTPYMGVPAVMSMKKSFESKLFPKELFQSYTTLEFENYTFSAICRYDEFLRIFYGDYMQLPPVDQRVGKHDIVAYYK